MRPGDVRFDFLKRSIFVLVVVSNSLDCVHLQQGGRSLQRQKRDHPLISQVCCWASAALFFHVIFHLNDSPHGGLVYLYVS
jgi:hypothetical protein